MGLPMEAGGGFTFEESVLKALLESKNRHRLYFLAGRETRELKKLHPDFIFLQQNRTLFMRAVDKIRKLVTGHVRVSPLNQAIRKFRLEAVIFVTPVYSGEDVDAPFIFPVWDLQHRLQPFFPEVSLNGLWEDREKVYGFLLPRAAYVVTGTAEGRREIAGFYRVPEERIRVLPLPAPDFGRFLALGVGQTEIPSGRYLFYPARFWPHKNHVVLLHTLKILKEKYALDFQLVLVGNDWGNERYVRKVTAELNLTEKVYFKGFVSRLDLTNLYRNAFALVFPSFFGPDNIPPLEAFVLGCPVIAADVPGSAEQIGEACLLVPPADAEKIAWAVKKLDDEPELRRKLIERGRQIAANRTPEKYAAALIAILDEFTPVRRTWDDRV